MIRNDDDLDRVAEVVRNWGRWGDDDAIGTLNLLTPERRIAAARLVKVGVTTTLGRTVQLASDTVERGVHEHTARPGGGARDFIGLVFHGFTVTHIDAPVHVSYAGTLYNGRLWDSADSADLWGDVIPLATAGIAGRGVLLDIERSRGQALEIGAAVEPRDLDDCERAARVRVSTGDLLWVRTGTGGMNSDRLSTGLAPECLAWLRERDVALVGGDGDSEVRPNVFQRRRSPIHEVGIHSMGLAVVDNADLERLAALCTALKRWEFLCVVSALPFSSMTGSPVAPIAIF